MGNFKEVFTNSHAVLPVVHVQDELQTLANTQIAQDAGCDGVFLISMKGMHHLGLLTLQNTIKDTFPDFWIGVNYLDLSGFSVFDNVNPKVDGVWTDNARIYEAEPNQHEADFITEKRKQSRWNGLYFGGVAFKYQPGVTDYAKAARTAMFYMDVITTSGSATGSAPDVEKIQIMKEAIGDFPLGIASGITPENVHNFTDYADVFLVATSLLTPRTEMFDKARVVDLVSGVRG